MLGKEVTQSLTWKKQKATCREMSNDIVGSCKALWDNWIHTRLQVPIILILGILIWESSYHIFTKFHVKWTMTFFFGAEAFDLVLRKGQPGEARSAFPHFFWGGVIFSSKSSFFSRPTTLELKLEAPSPCSRRSWKLEWAFLEEILLQEINRIRKATNSSDLLIQQDFNRT